MSDAVSSLPRSDGTEAVCEYGEGYLCLGIQTNPRSELADRHVVQRSSHAKLKCCRCHQVIVVQPERGEKLQVVRSPYMRAYRALGYLVRNSAAGRGAMVVVVAVRPAGHFQRHHLPGREYPQGRPVSRPGMMTTPYLQENLLQSKMSSDSGGAVVVETVEYGGGLQVLVGGVVVVELVDCGGDGEPKRETGVRVGAVATN
ncbi:hypothetical protein L1987_48303 [Smallanthus sonchifolius]|uniref:Uncharacterized protein n=1 Tax=Smallanthus sonchifolius TaxID=185202 RepID=A0ACB9FSP9_9ASTR|nr:hypothetical protein L1987_48303 [Smallanthus sonchifolius]